MNQLSEDFGFAAERESQELLRLLFKINNSQAIIGTTTPLTIKNASLAAAGKNALSLDVSGSVDGAIGIYSSIAGSIKYFHGKQ